MAQPDEGTVAAAVKHAIAVAIGGAAQVILADVGMV